MISPNRDLQDAVAQFVNGFRHDVLLLLSFSPDHRGLTAPRNPPCSPGRSSRQRSGQAENWGRPSGGTDFLLARTGDGFISALEGSTCAGLTHLLEGENRLTVRAHPFNASLSSPDWRRDGNAHKRNHHCRLTGAICGDRSESDHWAACELTMTMQPGICGRAAPMRTVNSPLAAGPW